MTPIIKRIMQKTTIFPLLLLLLGSCSEKITGKETPLKYSCNSISVTYADLKNIYTANSFSRLSFKFTLGDNGSYYPEFYSEIGGMNLQSTVFSINTTVLLTTVDPTTFYIDKRTTPVDQIQKLLSIPYISYFILDPSAFDDPNYPYTPYKLQYRITPYNKSGSEIHVTAADLGITDLQFARLMRIDPIPPGGVF